jgi:hypothetical protein
VGKFSPNHATETLRMWDQDTKTVHLSRDIAWLNKMFSYHLSNFINIPRKPNKNSLNATTNNPGNKLDFDNQFQIDKEFDNPDITNNITIENINTTKSGRVI